MHALLMALEEAQVDRHRNEDVRDKRPAHQWTGEQSPQLEVIDHFVGVIHKQDAWASCEP